MPTLPRYPVYIPSRDRAHVFEKRYTGRRLDDDGVPWRVVVVPSQVDAYAAVVGEDRVLALPDDDHVLKDARCWIKDHATADGFDRHWQLDDNIKDFRRLHRGRRIPCDAGLALRACEDFTDRYANVAVSGLNYQMFVTATSKPFAVNVHVYSCTLVNNATPHRWRLVYNDDTDLCLQVLADGWCTLALNVFMADKERTMKVSGGNTNQLYEGDGRLRMARTLERAWPGVVSVDRRFGRPQHVIDWTRFTTPLELRSDGAPVVDYDAKLVAKREVKSPTLRAWVEEV